MRTLLTLLDDDAGPELPKPSAVTGGSFYDRIFSVQELAASRTLHWFYGSSLLYFFVTFFDWARDSALSRVLAQQGRHSCPPYFQGCGRFYFFTSLPYGYSQGAFYALLFAIMTLCVLALRRGRWALAHRLMVVLFFWKATAMLVLTDQLGGNYNSYHLILSFILLFLPYKLYFLRRAFVLLYFLASTVKLNDGWILGTYFSALHPGLPLLPDAFIPVATNLVILFEMAGSWLLLSSHLLLQRLVLSWFVFFHLYSITLVNYNYPTMVLGALLVLFGPRHSSVAPPMGWRSLPGWALLACMLGLQSIPHLISRDVTMTLEGNKYGLYMFEANHQCVSSYTIRYADGRSRSRTEQSPSARNRCDPYRKWFRLSQRCLLNPGIARIGWTFDHSVNGGPFYRIVDVEDACGLRYHAFRHNPWILLPDEGARIVGVPVKNLYY